MSSTPSVCAMSGILSGHGDFFSKLINGHESSSDDGSGFIVSVGMAYCLCKPCA